MTPQPGTPLALIQSLQAPNFMDNISIQKALAYQAYLNQIGLPFDSMVVQQTNGASSPDQTFTFASLQSMGIDQSAPLYCQGIAKGTSYTIALEIQLIAGQDGSTSYMKLYNERNPGTTQADALAAMNQIPAIADANTKFLNNAKTSNGIM